MKTLAAAMLLAVMIMTAACDRVPDVAGVYRTDPEAGGTANITLELDKDGDGTWSTDLDRVELTWTIKDGHIWLHTQSGGVITGRVEKNGISLDMPGAGTVALTKSKD